MASEVDSLRALALEANETVTLTREFYRCVVKDPRTKSGQMTAVKPQPPAPKPIFTDEEVTPTEGFAAPEATTAPAMKKPAL